VAWRHAENFWGATGGARQNFGGQWPPWHPPSSAPAGTYAQMKRRAEDREEWRRDVMRDLP